MNRNQKIALGCGGAGCLGLIVVAIAGCLIYFLAYRSPRSSYNYNYNVSTNRNSNANDNSNFNTNSNVNSTSNANSSTSSSAISSDDKHKLYHAAGMTGDAELIRRVSVKIGILEDDYSMGDKYQAFIDEHATWAISNFDFIRSTDTAEKARAYINGHLPE